MINIDPTTAFLVSFALCYYWHALGGTLGYHRILSHKSLVVPKWLEYLIVSGGYLGLEGSPIFWVSTHRRHHRYSDQPGDPHTPRDGVWHSVIAWMWSPKTQMTSEESQKMVPDLYRDPLYKLLHCKHTHWDGFLCLFLSILFRVAIFYVFGIWALLGNILGSIVAFCGPLLVNSVCHMRQFGYETYKAGDGSRNVWFVALLSLGEGWHNNHHAFPQSARHGLKGHEIDATWITIKVLEKLGLARSIRLPKSEMTDSEELAAEKEMELSVKS
ncbi:MAG: fatty acid desaturase [Candidatus Melainabacteria bacterium]|nr:MAG: fatty acid desaturase [Candidatus Melainabacteria bacterium]